MFTEKQLDLLKEGKIPLSFDDKGTPLPAVNTPFFELMLFVRALALGYMRLYNRVQIREKCAKAKIDRKENVS